MTFSEKLRAYRFQLSLTQKKLAEILKVSLRTVSNWERDQRSPGESVQRGVEQILEEKLERKRWQEQERLASTKERSSGKGKAQKTRSMSSTQESTTTGSVEPSSPDDFQFGK